MAVLEKTTMKTCALILAGVAALFLATGAAHAAEWQCGPHYVSTFGLHGWPGEEKARQCRDFHILAYPAYNQTREQAGEKFDDETRISLGTFAPSRIQRTMRLTLSGQTMLSIFDHAAATTITII
jgi:hypothetical protein